jgi:hypothetical protein
MLLKDHLGFSGYMVLVSASIVVGQFRLLKDSEGTVHEFDTPEYNALIPLGNRKPGSRSAIVVDVYKVSMVRNPSVKPPISSLDIACHSLDMWLCSSILCIPISP